MEVGGQRHAPAALPAGKRPGTHCVGGWVDPKAGLDGCGKSHLQQGLPDRPALYLHFTHWAFPARYLKI
jgi:hypothetical protein